MNPMNKLIKKYPLQFWAAGIAVGILIELWQHNGFGAVAFFCFFWGPGLYAFYVTEIKI